MNASSSGPRAARAGHGARRTRRSSARRSSAAPGAHARSLARCSAPDRCRWRACPGGLAKRDTLVNADLDVVSRPQDLVDPLQHLVVGGAWQALATIRSDDRRAAPHRALPSLSMRFAADLAMPTTACVPSRARTSSIGCPQQFEALRRNRREHRTRRAMRPRKRRAALTIVRDEAVFFPIWLDYYSRFFAPEDIYVLDHETSDRFDGPRGLRPDPGHARDGRSHVDGANDRGAPARAARPIRRRARHRRGRDRRAAPRVRHARRVHRPLRRGIRQLPRLRAHPSGRPRGAIRPARKVLAQRGYWFANEIYDKPALTTRPMRWRPGFHRSADGRMRPDPTST